jgi:hypothetical protein
MKNENVKAPRGAETFDGSTGIFCQYTTIFVPSLIAKQLLYCVIVIIFIRNESVPITKVFN